MWSQANALLQKWLVPNMATKPSPMAQLPTPINAMAPIQRGMPNSQNQRQNPFMIAMDPENPNFMGYYGVNRPLKQPMFFGYQDNKPLYGGGRLFILY